MATIHTSTRPQNGGHPQFSPETCGKLHRIQAIATYLFVDSQREQNGTMLQLLLPHLTSYMHDDLCYIVQEARELGLLPDTPQN